MKLLNLTSNTMKYKKFFVFLVIFSMLLVPVISSAQAGGNLGCNLKDPDSQEGTKLGDLFSYATCIILRSIIPLIFAIALMMFIWGVVQYVINTENEEKRNKGKSYMVWGLIGLTVMVSVWGLVAILGNTIEVDTGVIPQLPTGNSNN